MSYCREEGTFYVSLGACLDLYLPSFSIAGKDKVIFVTEEDHAAPSTVVLGEDEEDEMEGLIKANGEINWDCPCLQGMAYGPCGEQFKAAFSCFHYSEVEPKGSDCIPQFRDMQECFVKYPEIYGKDNDEALETEDDGELKNDEIEMTKESGENKENKEFSEQTGSPSKHSKEVLVEPSTDRILNEASS